jgi:hypothetical protein
MVTTGSDDDVDKVIGAQLDWARAITRNDADDIAGYMTDDDHPHHSRIGALILGTTLTTGGGLLAPTALADPVDTTTVPTPDGFAYQPLWPFASQDEADRWLRDGADAGGAPWHADPKTTAPQALRLSLSPIDADGRSRPHSPRAAKPRR